MNRMVATAAALGALLAVSGTGYAADSGRNTANQQGVTATNPAGSDMIKPDQIRASKMIGSTVYDVHNQKLGSVKDLVLDKDGKVSDVVIKANGKYVAVRMSNIKSNNNRLTLDMSKDQLKQAANYQLEDKATGAGQSASPVHGGKLGASDRMSGSSTAPSSTQR